MRISRVAAAAVLLALAGIQPAAAYKIDGKALIYADEENASGYRLVTSAEPAAGDGTPLYTVTFYPESDLSTGISLSYTKEEGPGIDGTNSTVILRTNILINP